MKRPSLTTLCSRSQVIDVAGRAFTCLSYPEQGGNCKLYRGDKEGNSLSAVGVVSRCASRVSSVMSALWLREQPVLALRVRRVLWPSRVHPLSPLFSRQKSH